MQITYAALSTEGPVRDQNEDCIAYWQPKDQDEWRSRGAIAILADGVGGQARGEVASKLACKAAVQSFMEAKPLAVPTQTLAQMFAAANLAVYDENVKHNGLGRMATTLTASIFRHNEVNIAHVGDCRVYAIQQGRIRRVTNDHSYAGVQLKLGLINVDEMMSSQMRSVLTRTVGQEPTLRVDYHTINVHRGDIIVQMCDGMWTQITEGEIYDAATKQPAEAACKSLVKLAERRGADDNLSIQIIQVQAIERLSYYRGLPTYQKESPAVMGSELEVGQVLDDRFRITDVISRSGMASIFKAIDQNTGDAVALKVPFMQFESDPGFYQRFQREQAIGNALQHPYILKMMDDETIKKSRPYIVMEYLQGQTLGHLMHTIRPMPEADALKIVSRVCEALHYMHEHDVVHRDLKPDNIMICSDGSIRIMDFGIAKFERQRRLTFGGFTPAMGTPDYMAPEQVKGKRGDARTDIYSLGRDSLRNGYRLGPVRGSQSIHHHEQPDQRRSRGPAQAQRHHLAAGRGNHPARHGPKSPGTLRLRIANENGAGPSRDGATHRPMRSAGRAESLDRQRAALSPGRYLHRDSRAGNRRGLASRASEHQRQSEMIGLSRGRLDEFGLRLFARSSCSGA